TLYDAAYAPICRLIYDLSDPAVLQPPTRGYDATLPAGVVAYETWDLIPANGWTDCPGLDLSVGWGPSPANRIQGPPWGLIFGSMLTLDADMQADPTIGPDWATDYAP